MTKTIPSSLTDAIEEDPERFLSYLNIEKITSSKNPYQEFLKQFKKNFNSDKGLNLWQYMDGRYKLLNTLFKNVEIQKSLKKEFKGSLNRKQKDYFFKEEEKKIKQTKIILEEKKVIVGSYLRNKKEIKSYKKTVSHKYTERQKTFIMSRKSYSPKKLAYEFNIAFGTNVSEVGIRDKKARILGKKK